MESQSKVEDMQAKDVQIMEDAVALKEDPRAQIGGRITVTIYKDGRMDPQFDGLSPFEVPIIMRRVANALEAELVR